MTKRPPLEFRILGPLQVLRNGQPIGLGGQRQRLLLAILVLNANRVVPTHRLAEMLFGEATPERAAQAVRVAVSRLRRSLGEPSTPQLVLTRPAGYELQVDPATIDLHQFEQIVAAGRSHLPHDPAAAGRELATGLALWRGTALADIAHAESIAEEARRIDELRNSALSDRIDADLATGHAAEVTPELEEMVAAEPYRERYRAQLMLALYRAGRQNEALDVYAATRRLLHDEVGLEPGPELQQLQAAILRHDQELAPPRRPTPPTDGPSTRRITLTLAAVALAAVAVSAIALFRDSVGSPARPLVRPARILATIAIPNPSCCSVTGQAVWSAGHHDGLLYRIDPTTNKIAQTWRAAGYQAGVPDATTGDVWVPSAAGGLIRFDPARRRVVARVDDAAAGISYAYLALWQTSREHQLLRVNTRTNRVRIVLHYSRGENDWDDSITFGAGSIWIGVGDTGQLVRVDPKTFRIVKRIFLGSTYSELVAAYDDGAIWAFRFVGGQQILFRVDPATNRVVARIPVGPPGGGPPNGGISAGGGYIWTCDWDDKISKVDEQTNRVVARYTLPAGAEFVNYGDGSLWASAYDASRVYRIDPTR